jgi:hypothetical protein
MKRLRQSGALQARARNRFQSSLETKIPNRAWQAENQAVARQVLDLLEFADSNSRKDISH